MVKSTIKYKSDVLRITLRRVKCYNDYKMIVNYKNVMIEPQKLIFPNLLQFKFLLLFYEIKWSLFVKTVTMKKKKYAELPSPSFCRAMQLGETYLPASLNAAANGSWATARSLARTLVFISVLLYRNVD